MSRFRFFGSEVEDDDKELVRKEIRENKCKRQDILIDGINFHPYYQKMRDPNIYIYMRKDQLTIKVTLLKLLL